MAPFSPIQGAGKSYTVITTNGRAVLRDGQVVESELGVPEVLKIVTDALLTRSTIEAAEALTAMQKYAKENS